MDFGFWGVGDCQPLQNIIITILYHEHFSHGTSTFNRNIVVLTLAYISPKKHIFHLRSYDSLTSFEREIVDILMFCIVVIMPHSGSCMHSLIFYNRMKIFFIFIYDINIIPSKQNYIHSLPIPIQSLGNFVVYIKLILMLISFEFHIHIL